jgi:long-chain-fatty-acid--[acyl-carrier-protein] ligase
MLFLEEVRKKLTTAQKLIGIARSMRGRAALIRSLGLDRGSEEEIAAILFTSGTEAVPKGVPLTHKNIIFNQRSGMQCVDFQASDCMYGILPPFHSFGFNVAGLFPLFMGMKIAFYPDPTDSFALAEGIERWKITVFCAAPSFLKALLAAATPQQLQSIRYWVSGAEKLPQEVREKALAMVPQSTVLEGYGITECAPVLTLCRANLPPVGVGQFIPGVDVCIIHPETLQKLDLSVDGEICVAGPNVFNGYLGNPRSPFIDIDGRRWYRTGDLGHLDAAGNLILSGRLKRFTKIGGEMISLGAIEEAIAADLLRRGVVSPDLPAVAVCSDERIPGKPQIVLFCIAPIERDQANEILKSAGFSRLVRISSVHRVEEIPLMGAGKTDYRKLQAILA